MSAPVPTECQLRAQQRARVEEALKQVRAAIEHVRRIPIGDSTAEGRMTCLALLRRDEMRLGAELEVWERAA